MLQFHRKTVRSTKIILMRTICWVELKWYENWQPMYVMSAQLPALMNKMRYGTMTVSWYHQIHKIFLSDNAPKYPDHDFPIPYKTIPDDVMILSDNKDDNLFIDDKLIENSLKSKIGLTCHEVLFSAVVQEILNATGSSYDVKFVLYIHSNFWVAQNRRFTINPVYLEVAPWLPKFGILGSLESLKNAFFRTWFSPKLILESWILHYLCESFPEYPLDITIGTLITVYLVL